MVEFAASAGAKVVRVPFHRWLAFVASIVGHSRFRLIRMGRSRSLRRRQNSGRNASRRRPVLGRHRRLPVRSLGDERHGLASRDRLLPASLGDRPLRMGGSGHQTKQAGNGLRRRPARSRLPVGPYAYIRHPFYTAYLLFWLGCAIATSSLILFLVFLSLAVLYTIAALGEERNFSRSAISDEYEAFRKATGFFWPKLRLARR